MLDRLGIDSVDELYDDVPQAARLKEPLNIGRALDEMSLSRHMTDLARQNWDIDTYPCFLGGGFYDRFVPAAVLALASRGEYATSYTPYQAELSQGTLAGIFEFQSMIQSLTGTDAAQASMYDGASAVGEAVLLALGQAPDRHRVLILDGVLPETHDVVQTYVRPRETMVTVCDSLEELRQQLNDQVAAVVMQYPDLYGRITLAQSAIRLAHEVGALAIVATDPVALSVITPPGDLGADIVVGEGQPLGNPLNYGGPTFGFFAVKKPLLRRMPGRLVGATRDRNGQRSFVLTLQAREQHIRREKATSNICSNHSLNALMATIYMALMGPQGLRDVTLRSASMAHYLEKELSHLGLFRYPDPAQPFLYEFVVRIPKGSVDDLNRFLLQQGIIGGLALQRWNPRWHGLWQLAVTERRTKEDSDRLVEGVKQWMSQ